MSWPVRLRALSFTIGMGVVMTEVAVVAIPVGFVIWLFGAASVWRIAAVAIVIAFAVALAVIVPTHLRPARIARRQREGVTG